MLVWDAHVRDFLDAVPDAMLICDSAGAIAFANAQAARLLGYAGGELTGQPVEVLVPERVRDLHAGLRADYRARPVRRVMGEGRELTVRRRDGSELSVQISLSPVMTEQGVLVCSVIRDVSDHKRIEARLIAERQQAERDSRSKSAFLAAASHDLRQPLQTLTLLTAALGRAVPRESVATEVLQVQNEALQAMAGLLESLLDVGRVEAGMLQPTISAVPLQPLIGRLCREFGPQAHAKSLTLVAHPTQAVIQTDPALFEHVLQNLVANAIGFTRTGSVQLQCSDGPDGVRIDVIDTGIGIAPQECALLLQDQVLAPEKARRGGHGLGLSIVRLLSRALGLQVSVQSVPGEGTRFSVLAPAATPPLGSAAAVSA